MPWDETDNQIRQRIKEPGDFKAGSFRTVKLKGVEGISTIMGKLMPSKVPEGHNPGSMVVQAVRFNKDEGWTVEKAKDWMSEHNMKEIEEEAEKCMAEQPMAPTVFVPSYGGATSFGGLEAYQRASHLDMAVRELSSLFRVLSDNIFASEELEVEEKIAQLEKLTADFKDRLSIVQRTGEMPLNMKEERGFLGGIRSFFSSKAVTKTEGGTEFVDSDYADVLDSDKPSTWKLRLAEKKSGDFTVAQIARAITALQPGGFRGQRVELGQPRSTVVSKITTAIGKIPGASDEQRENLRTRISAVKEFKEGFSTFKTEEGNWAWYALVTNKFYDRDGEVFPEEAHKDYVNWVEETKEYPELWIWHIPGTKIGVADIIDYTDGFLVAAGHFDPGTEDVLEAFTKSERSWGVSHGYKFIRDEKDGTIIRHYRTKEISIVPEERAANRWTPFAVIKEESGMPIEKGRRELLVELLGEKRVVRLEESLPVLAKELEASGVAWKDFLEAIEPLGDPESTQAAQAFPEPKVDQKPDMDKVLLEAVGIINRLQEKVALQSKALEVHEIALKELKSQTESPAIGLFGIRPTDNLENVLSKADGERIKATMDPEAEREEKSKKNPALPYVNDLLGLPRVIQG